MEVVGEWLDSLAQPGQGRYRKRIVHCRKRVEDEDVGRANNLVSICIHTPAARECAGPRESRGVWRGGEVLAAEVVTKAWGDAFPTKERPGRPRVG